MKRVLPVSYSLFFLLLFQCASTSEVLFDYNLDTDFESYSSYVLCTDDFMVINTEHPNIDNETNRQLIATAVGNEMEARGHQTNVFDPQLQAGFRIAIQEETAKFNNCEHSGELNYWESCTIHEETYEQETLIVYVADFKTNQVLWQASLPCYLTKKGEKLELYITEIVNKLFETYPKSKESI